MSSARHVVGLENYFAFLGLQASVAFCSRVSHELRGLLEEKEEEEET